jgi:biopolymer transport protein ExbB
MRYFTFNRGIASVWVLMGLAGTAWAGDGGSPPTTTGFHRFFVSGGWLVWCILLPLSITTVSLIIQNFLSIRRSRLIPAGLLRQIRAIKTPGGPTVASNDQDDNSSMLSRIIEAVRQAAPEGSAAMENALSDSLEQETAVLLRKIEWLHIIGNVAPMIGLFGTVWGMIEAFNAIVQAGGQPTLGQLASGISVVLVATWWGLISAIPALAAFGVLRNRIDSFAAEIASTFERHVLTDKAEVK